MDRPLGTKHPKHGFVYEVNYGYIPNTVSGDGEELDAYVLGIDKPLKEFTVNDNRIVITVPIVLRKYVNTVFDKTKNGVLTVTDNNHLILKAFVTAWRYREMYERYGDTDKIIAMEHTSPRQFYRHLDLAYMNPETINHILSGKQKVNVNDLFQIAKSDLFKQGPNML